MAKEIKSLYYFYGTEEYLVDKAVAEIKAGALDGAMGSLNFRAYEGASLDAAELISEAMTMPAFAPWRVLHVKGAEAMKKPQRTALVEYLKAPSPTTCLIFTASTKKIESSEDFFKILKSDGSLVAMKQLSEREISAWIKREAETNGKKISPQVVEALVRIGGRRLRDVTGELTKIILFVGERDRIEAADVESAGVNVREETVFDLTDAVGRRDLKAAVKVMAKLSREPQLKVLGAIARQIRILLRIKMLKREGVSRGALPKKLGIMPFFLDKYLASAAAFREEELLGAITRLSEADMEIKSSKLTPELVMTRLVLSLCAGGSSRA